MDDRDLATAIGSTTVLARVSPEQKARLVTVQRRSGGAVAFLGDGVNDALGLHAADVGISVDSAVDVAKDAADVILLEKDLNVLANGVVGGRRGFANTVKYVLMGTSSNFGDFATFAILLWVFHAGPELFRSGWFVESLATQTLVISAIRTRRSPFWRSTPSAPLIATVVAVVAVGATLPATPLGPTLGFTPLSTALYVTLAVLVVAYC
jgi:magnesium-transporting ATPase (P-type)